MRITLKQMKDVLRMGGMVMDKSWLVCSHPDCDSYDTTETDIGWLCARHLELALEIMRGESRLMREEDKTKALLSQIKGRSQ